jgi:predicted Zn finger-like uncharacterized protein
MHSALKPHLVTNVWPAKALAALADIAPVFSGRIASSSCRHCNWSSTVPIQTACPHCDREYTLADDKEGKTVKCKACEETFVVIPLISNSDETSADSNKLPRKGDPERKASCNEREGKYCSEGLRHGETARGSPWGGRRRKRADTGPKLRLAVVFVGAALVVIPCFVGGIFLLVGATRVGAPVNETTFDQLHVGMTEREICGMMGSPTSTEHFGGGGRGRVRQAGTKLLYWDKGDNEISAFIDQGAATAINGTFKDPNTGEIHYRQHGK